MGEVRAMRSEQDIPQYLPRWFIQFGQRIGKLERGKVYDISLVMPKGEGDPQWFVKMGTKLEGE